MPALLAEATNRRPARRGVPVGAAHAPVPVSADRQRQISVLIVGHDPVSRAGVERQLVGLDDIAVLAPAAGARPDIALVVAGAIDEEVLGWIRTIRRHGRSRVVVVTEASTQAIAAATDAGASAVVPRVLADGRRLLWAIQEIHRGEPLSAVAAGPTRQPAPATPPRPHETTERADAVSERDREVLRLLAEGCDTGEIARSLAYSEPTIKNAIQRLFEQLNAKNRPHAVALALRAGII